MKLTVLYLTRPGNSSRKSRVWSDPVISVKPTPLTTIKKPMRAFLIFLLLTLFQDRRVGDACDRCETMYDGMPKTMSSQTTLGNNEPGEPMIIEGTIYKKDGKTPASNVILYVYHTDAKGYYSNPPGQKEVVHGHLRGWIKTGPDGKYKFTSIRPAPYPDG